MLQWGRTREGAEGRDALLNFLDHISELQWGRTREGAEGCATIARLAQRSSLQWGRTREGAEGTLTASGELLATPASVGPHP